VWVVVVVGGVRVERAWAENMEQGEEMKNLKLHRAQFTQHKCTYVVFVV
jgi:hypothetical protein